MIRLDCEQGSPQWIEARLGIPTASQFGRILTPTGKPSAAAPRYMHELLVERALRHSLDPFLSEFMERGNEIEQQAYRFYEFERNCSTEAVGLCFRDDKRAACSPDRLVAEAGGLEIKAPSAVVHMGYLLEGEQAPKYKPQVQGSLWVTGRQWWDWLSFNPELPQVLVRAERDEAYISALDQIVPAFCDELDKAWSYLCETHGIEAAE